MARGDALTPEAFVLLIGVLFHVLRRGMCGEGSREY